MVTGRRKLLLADDSPTIQKVINLTFADEGMEVFTASDGREALRLLEEAAPFDIVLADAVMPGPDGYELCERIKRDARLQHVPVVLLVGTFEPFNEAEARRVGADTFLTKPFQSIRDLVSKVGSLLGGESKEESREHGHEHEAAARDAERPAPREATPAPRVEAQPSDVQGTAAPIFEPPPAPAEPARPDPSSSFADLGDDDKLIEAMPADSYSQTPSHARDPLGFDEADAGAQSRRPHEAGGHSFDAPAQPFAASYREAEEGAQAAQPAFAARAASAAAADDALLDLGQIDSHADSGDEADDFILDLTDDFSPASAREEATAFDSPLSFGETDFDAAPADNAGAFAEAAHGEPFDFSASPDAAAGVLDAELSREVVSQDVPPSASGSDDAPTADGLATSYLSGRQSFIEPEVVPAEEPAPAGVKGDFTEGSVEGDVPRPPAEVASSAAPAPEPSTAGRPVGEARVGFEESAASAQLSPETIEAIARRVVELMSDKVVREVAWEVVPDLAELLIKRRLDEERDK